MTLFDAIKKVYPIVVKCSNCNHKFELRIPKGTTISDYLQSEASTCENCGCSTLIRIVLDNPKHKEQQNEHGR